MHANVRQEIEAGGHWLMGHMRVLGLVSAYKQALQFWPEGEQRPGDMISRGVSGIPHWWTSWVSQVLAVALATSQG